MLFEVPAESRRQISLCGADSAHPVDRRRRHLRSSRRKVNPKGHFPSGWLGARRPELRTGSARRTADADDPRASVYHTGRASRVKMVDVARPPMTTTAIESM